MAARGKGGGIRKILRAELVHLLKKAHQPVVRYSRLGCAEISPTTQPVCLAVPPNRRANVATQAGISSPVCYVRSSATRRCLCQAWLLRGGLSATLGQSLRRVTPRCMSRPQQVCHKWFYHCLGPEWGVGQAATWGLYSMRRQAIGPLCSSEWGGEEN